MIKIILLVLLVGFVLAIKFLPWWALLLIGLCFLISLKYAITALFTMPFKMKGKVLRGAKVQVHGVVPTQKPVKQKAVTAGGGGDDDEEDDDDEPESSGPRDYYTLDITITPGGEPGNFSHWDPSDISLATMDAKPDPGGEEDCGEVVDYEIFTDGKFAKDEGEKYPGPQRLKMTVAVRPNLPRVRFRYYFELFGDVPLKKA